MAALRLGFAGVRAGAEPLVIPRSANTNSAQRLAPNARRQRSLDRACASPLALVTSISS
jgi:hypothetical protein